MNLKVNFKDLRPDPSKMTGSYQDSLIHVTKLGTQFTAVFFLAFAFVYWQGGYPVQAMWVNLIATLCSLLGFVLITRFKKHRPTAHLVTFAIYISSAGVMMISGGIHSSSTSGRFSCPLRPSSWLVYGQEYAGEPSVLSL